MIKSFNRLDLHFFSQKLSSGRYSIRARITIDGKKEPISTGVVLDSPKQWKNPIVVAHKQAKQFNDRLTLVKSNLIECYNRLDSLGEYPTAHLVKSIYIDKRKPPLTVLEAVRKYVGHKASEGWEAVSVGKHDVACRHFERFLKANKLLHLPANDFKKHHAEGFFEFCKTKLEKPNSGRVARRKVGAIKSALDLALDREEIQKNVVSNLNLKVKNEKKEIVFLYPFELEILENKVFHLERLNDEKDVFLFQCYTGLAHCDVLEFNDNPKKNLVEVRGETWIKFKRKKTGTTIEVPLFSKAKSLLEKYDYDLPTKGNGKRNEYLKEIAVLCEFSINLTTHVARKTFGMILLNFENVPLEIVSKLLSHSSIVTTLRHYAKVLPETIQRSVAHLL
ncbi:site-specific integrase [Bernardetia sp. Wsw4-3y2]|uniref:site-specific integrase n=1 Tax=Bernardetia sp. Wsw4-3y2 TaxID=3127471 RepID=UPI0030CDE6DB